MTRLDESEIIRIFQDRLRNKGWVPEDVEVFRMGRQGIVAKTDTLVESTDIPPGMKLSDAARKSVVACVSDFASKGVKPEYGMVSINLPDTISRPKVRDLARGFRQACDEFDMSILGGDTNAGREIVLNVCIFGHADKIVRRRGARNGDLIFVTGPFGYASAGLSILLGKKRASGTFRKRSLGAVTRPEPRLGFALKNRRYFSSSMDSSDGLSTTLNEMSRQSKKRFLISSIPSGEGVEDFARSQKLDLHRLVFHGGEEYEFVFTASPEHEGAIRKSARLLKTPIIEIGRVASGSGVVIDEGDRHVLLKDSGWKHFG